MSATFEINADNVDVEEIMKKIRANIAAKKAAGAVSAEDGKLVLTGGLPALSGESPDLAGVNMMWDIENRSYHISSHRRILGWLLVRGRRLISGEVKRYVDPVIQRQKEFNASMVRIVNDLSTGRDEPAGMRREMEERIDMLERMTKKEIGVIKNDIEGRMAGIGKRNGAEETPELFMLGNDPMNYFVFEDRFRGSRKEISGRQSAFLKYFTGCSSVLDIGCGRGEFLELMKDNDIKAGGIDINQDMVNFCLSMGFDVRLGDALSYLKTLGHKSVDGIFIDQVVEHLDPSYMARLLEECYKKLAFGRYLVIQTMNPLTLISFSNFYMDPTHRRPVHPETLRFVAESLGFREVVILYTSPTPERGRLKRLAPSQGDPAFVETYNRNVDALNDTLFGSQDYAVIAKK